MAATEPFRDKQKLRQLARYFLQRGQVRNYTMLILGVHTALRVGDLLYLAWDDVYDEKSDEYYTHVTLTEKKTGKIKTIALNRHVINALRLLHPYKHGEYIFASNRRNPAPISRVQAWRIIRNAAEAIKLSGCFGCHSLRKTFGYFAWKSGVLPVMLMDIFNHSSFEITKRYLGISQDDRDKVYLNLTIF